MKIKSFPFQEKYRANFLRIIDTEEICSVRSRTAQRILMSHAVDIQRHKEIREINMPRWYKFIHYLTQILP